MCALQKKFVLGHSTLNLAEPSSYSLHPAPRQARQVFQSTLQAEVGWVALKQAWDFTHAFYQRLQCTTCCSAEANVNKIHSAAHHDAHWPFSQPYEHGSRAVGHALTMLASACQSAASSR